MNDIKNNTPEWSEFLRSIGSITIQWGLAEHCLDALTAILFKEYGKRFKEKRLPKMLAIKIKFADKCLSRVSELSKLESEGKFILAEFTRLSERRHEITHGALTHLPINGVAVFTKLDIKDNIHHQRSFPFDSEKSQILTQELQVLGNDTANFLGRVQSIFLSQSK